MNGKPRNYFGIFLLLAVSGAAWDLGTKWLAFTLVGQPGVVGRSNRIPLLSGVFSFTTSYNRGALWGVGDQIVRIPHPNLVFAVLSVLAAAAILYWLVWHGGARDRLLSAALGLIMAGTLGNCYDRLLHPGVRDFLYFELINWPIFNFADTFLVCGAFLLMIQAFFSEFPLGKANTGPGSAVAAPSEAGQWDRCQQ